MDEFDELGFAVDEENSNIKRDKGESFAVSEDDAIYEAEMRAKEEAEQKRKKEAKAAKEALKNQEEKEGE